MKAATSLCVCLALAACNPQPQHAPRSVSTPSPEGLPPLQITGRGSGKQPVHFLRQSGNRKVYALQARSYVSHASRQAARTVFSDATVTFFDKDGTRLTANAPRALIDDRARLVVLSGGVHAVTSTGLRLVCDRLTYDQRTEMLAGLGSVRMTGAQGGQQQELTGSSFTSNINLTQMVVK